MSPTTVGGGRGTTGSGDAAPGEGRANAPAAARTTTDLQLGAGQVAERGTGQRTSVASFGRASVRKLHAGHFAFMRSVLQGLDPRASWERYVRTEGDAADPRVVRSTIAWIRDEFAVAARRDSRFGTARLVLMDASRVDDRATPAVPSLEAFVFERGLEDFSEREQLEAFEDAHGRATPRASRRTRLVRHQLEALRWLETRVAQPPAAADDVAAWFPPALANRLAAAHVHTVAALVERIDTLGPGWHTGIRGVGTVKAERVLAWLADHARSIGVRPGEHIRRARSGWDPATRASIAAGASEIRPFERLAVPAALDGSAGRYRLPPERCLLAARNDHEAIAGWLASKAGVSQATGGARAEGNAVPPRSPGAGGRRHGEGGATPGPQVAESALPLAQSQLLAHSHAPSLLDASPDAPALSHTQRSYRKEAERFLLWAIVQKGRALSSMTHEDCLEYRQFLADPQPRARWCGPRSRERWSPLWRPFEGPLGASAQAHAVRVLGNLWAFLADMNYLSGNPWRGVARPRSSTPRVDPGRSLSRADWRFVSRRLQALPAGDAPARLRIALPLLYATGLRSSEIVRARVADLVEVDVRRGATIGSGKGSAASGKAWMLSVVGKGGHVREVPLPESVVEQLTEHLLQRGVAFKPTADRASNDRLGDGRADLAGFDPEAHLLGRVIDLPPRARGLALRHGSGAGVSRSDAGISSSTLYDQLKRFLTQCGDELARQGDAGGARRLRAASTHWLRHTHASHSIADGVDLRLVQQNLGHASLATTTVYVTSEREARIDAIEAFWQRQC